MWGQKAGRASQTDVRVRSFVHGNPKKLCAIREFCRRKRTANDGGKRRHFLPRPILRRRPSVGGSAKWKRRFLKNCQFPFEPAKETGPSFKSANSRQFTQIPYNPT